ncbi:MAG: hypothetical protein R3B91_09555 [Planctomycetaceae bacterium]
MNVHCGSGAAHYHAERNHQELCSQLIVMQDEGVNSAGEVKLSERLGGLLRYYHRRAA